MYILRTRTERLTVTGMLIAVGIILPFAASHGIGIPGNVLLPMHIPVFICGLLCGPLFGAPRIPQNTSLLLSPPPRSSPLIWRAREALR